MSSQTFRSPEELDHVVNLLHGLSKLEQLGFHHTSVPVQVTTSQLDTFSRRALILPALQRIIFAGISASYASVILSAISSPPGQSQSILFLGRLKSWAYWPRIYTSLTDLQGPGWVELCNSVEKFSVTHGRDGHNVVVQSPGREVHLVGWTDALNELFTALEPALNHAREIWICADESVLRRGHSPDHLLEAILPHARMADIVFLDMQLPGTRSSSVFESLHTKGPKNSGDIEPKFLPVLANGHRHEMELHVKVDATNPKAYAEVHRFRAAIRQEKDTYGYISNICVYAPECKESLKLQKWAEKLTSDREANPLVQVLTNGETFPKILPSPTLTIPCPFRWR